MFEKILDYLLLLNGVVKVTLSYYIKVTAYFQMFSETYGGGSGRTATDFDNVNFGTQCGQDMERFGQVSC